MSWRAVECDSLEPPDPTADLFQPKSYSLGTRRSNVAPGNHTQLRPAYISAINGHYGACGTDAVMPVLAGSDLPQASGLTAELTRSYLQLSAVQPGLQIDDQPYHSALANGRVDRDSLHPLDFQRLSSIPQGDLSKPSHAISSQDHLHICYDKLCPWQHQPMESDLKFAVQLFPDTSTARLKLNCQVEFASHHRPSHHMWTAFHDYLAWICPEAGAKFVDVWLDSFHISLGTLYLPRHQVAAFQQLFDAAAAELPPLTPVEFQSVGMQYSWKPNNRVKKHSYHLLLDCRHNGILRSWRAALRHVAQQLCATFSQETEASYHVTITRPAKAEAAPSMVNMLRHAVKQNPLLFKIAGIRLQEFPDQALEHFGEDQIKTIVCSGVQIRYPVPMYTSCKSASMLIDQAYTVHRNKVLCSSGASFRQNQAAHHPKACAVSA